MAEDRKLPDMAGRDALEGEPRCHHCGAVIPVFTNLSGVTERRVRELIRQGRDLMAIEELRHATGCGVADAKVWVQHRGRPWPAEYGTAVCPFCGGALRTSLARQCPHCSRQWHESIGISNGAG